MHKKRAIIITLIIGILFMVSIAEAKYTAEQKAAEACSDRAFDYRREGKYDQAIEEYTKAINLNHREFYYQGRASVYYKLEKYDLALDDYNVAINMLTEPIEAGYEYFFSGRGGAYSALKKYDQAIADYTKALSLSSTYESFYWRGSAYQAQEKYDEAIADYTAAINRKPDKPFLYEIRGSAYYDKVKKDMTNASSEYVIGLFKVAFADFDQALSLDPENKAAHKSKGRALYSFNAYRESHNMETRSKNVDVNTKEGLSNAINNLIEEPKTAKPKKTKKEEEYDICAEAIMPLSDEDFAKVKALYLASSKVDAFARFRGVTLAAFYLQEKNRVNKMIPWFKENMNRINNNEDYAYGKNGKCFYYDTAAYEVTNVLANIPDAVKSTGLNREIYAGCAEELNAKWQTEVIEVATKNEKEAIESLRKIGAALKMMSEN